MLLWLRPCIACDESLAWHGIGLRNNRVVAYKERVARERDEWLGLPDDVGELARHLLVGQRDRLEQLRRRASEKLAEEAANRREACQLPIRRHKHRCFGVVAHNRVDIGLEDRL